MTSAHYPLELPELIAPENAVGRVGPLASLAALAERARTVGPAYRIEGHVSRLIPGCITASGLSGCVAIGDTVSVECGPDNLLGEVASIEADTINITMYDVAAHVKLRARVAVHGGPLEIAPDVTWRGRVLNALSQPIDNGPPLRQGPTRMRLDRSSPPPLIRAPLGRGIATGVKAIDIFTPICAGQRLGIFAGSGVGKSTLLSMLSRGPSFDATVFALVGERGREVHEFLNDTLGQARSNCVAVVATADESPMMRRMAPNTAMTIAEYFRDQGMNVLLVVDSITRYAHAARELALAAQEPPVARGYPPSVFSSLARLLERAGTADVNAGAITALLAVLVDGDDHNDPIADTTRGILDGHIVLDRAIAAEGRFPAIDPLRSLSRLAPKIRTQAQTRIVSGLLAAIQKFEDSRDIRMLGGYKPGADPDLDRAIAITPLLYDVLKQSGNDPSTADAFADVRSHIPMMIESR